MGLLAREGDLVCPLTVWDCSRRNAVLVANRVQLNGSSGISRGDHGDATELLEAPPNSARVRVLRVDADEAARRTFPVDAIVEALPRECTALSAALSARIAAEDLHMLVDSALQDDSVFKVPGAYRHILTRAEAIRYRALGGAGADAGAEGEGGCQVPVWEKVVCDCVPSRTADDDDDDDYGSSADMCNVVRRQWTVGRLSRFLDLLYIPSGGASDGEGGLPSALFDTDLSSRLDGREGEGHEIGSGNENGNGDGDEWSAAPGEDVGAVQIKFCLSQSSYATTFLALLSCV